MKKIFLFCMMALVGMCGLNSCSDDCDHTIIEHDHSADLVGTWTCLQKGFANALVINADGSMVATGLLGEEYWENLKGTIRVEDDKATLTYEDGVSIEGHFDIIPGMAFSIVQDNGERVTFNYCKEDLADEIVGMWVCNDGWTDDITIQTYSNDGKTTMTTPVAMGGDHPVVNQESNYKVVGNLLFRESLASSDADGKRKFTIAQLTYAQNGTSLGDIMTHKVYIPTQNAFVENIGSYLRIKQTLDLPGMKYDYIKTFVTNVKGLDKDIEFMGTTFNFAKMDGVKLDKMLKTLLFTVEFPDANTIKYSCYYNGQNMSIEAPIVVDGNKMTVKMSQKNPALKDVDLYTFQDQDNTQIHMYMHSTGFENFFGNMQVTIMEQLGMLDTTDAAAVKAVFDSIDEAVETINVSFVFKARK